MTKLYSIVLAIRRLLSRKVYVVTSGDYSDYHIECVFSSRRRAERYAAGMDGVEIETYLLNYSARVWGRSVFYVGMRFDGSTWGVYNLDSEVPSGRWGTINADGTDFESAVRVWAKDSAHAIKIVNEQRTQAIALHGEKLQLILDAQRPGRRDAAYLIGDEAEYQRVCDLIAESMKDAK